MLCRLRRWCTCANTTAQRFMPHACVQGRWIQDEFWIPLAEWWIETVLCTWEESVKVSHAVGRCLHVCLHVVVTPKTARAAVCMNQVSHSDWHGN